LGSGFQRLAARRKRQIALPGVLKRIRTADNLRAVAHEAAPYQFG
jgi:hypothetical protein